MATKAPTQALIEGLRVLRYLQGTKDVGLHYKACQDHDKVRAYGDANFGIGHRQAQLSNWVRTLSHGDRPNNLRVLLIRRKAKYRRWRVRSKWASTSRPYARRPVNQHQMLSWDATTPRQSFCRLVKGRGEPNLCRTRSIMSGKRWNSIY